MILATRNVLMRRRLRSKSAAEYALLYKKHALTGGHIIKLGPGNDEAALEAIRAWPGLFIKLAPRI